jgi:hypothetical protein
MHTPIYRFDIVQGSQEWLDIRAGKVTSSVAPSLFTKPRDKTQPFGAAAMEHAMRLAIERISGKPSPQAQFFSHATNRGNTLEPRAREHYELQKFTKVREVGFVDCGKFGDSPDGLVGDKGLVEIKCYTDPKNIMKAALGKNKDHDLQIKWHLYCCNDKDYCDFDAFYPELPKQSVIKTYYPDSIQNRLFDLELARFEAVIEEFIYKYENSELVN